ncbi:MAG: hypothetical protein AAF333_16225 [Planctomycetota bacterium]
MGYYVHITRSDIFSEKLARPITPEEWKAYVEGDPELSFDDFQAEGFAVWNGPSEHEEPWLAWVGGYVCSKHPDPPLIAKMIKIARELDAYTYGEDGEIYREGGKVVLPEDLIDLDPSELFCERWRLEGPQLAGS